MDQLGLWKRGNRVAVIDTAAAEAAAELVGPMPERPRVLVEAVDSGVASPHGTPEPSAQVDSNRPARIDVPRLLSRFMAQPTRVTYTNNRSTMISFRERHGVLDVRLHRMFEEASEGIVAALALYLSGEDKRAGIALDAFIRTHQEAEPPPPVVCQPTGRFHDLRALFDELNVTYFHGSCTSRITWGSAGGRRYRRSIQLGCYVRGEHLIRMHPSLDQSFVPRFYVAWIVFHEMLHEVFGVERRGSRHAIHPPEFVAVEQTFPDYARCKAWEAQNLPRLLRFGSARA
ncbi:MAG: hypothetical protein H7Z43_15880 [Clostridia bacterium]|nr:hypothetical protein [Deltaproteobacteria bacterium]